MVIGKFYLFHVHFMKEDEGIQGMKAQLSIDAQIVRSIHSFHSFNGLLKLYSIRYEQQNYMNSYKVKNFE